MADYSSLALSLSLAVDFLSASFVNHFAELMMGVRYCIYVCGKKQGEDNDEMLKGYTDRYTEGKNI